MNLKERLGNRLILKTVEQFSKSDEKVISTLELFERILKDEYAKSNILILKDAFKNKKPLAKTIKHIFNSLSKNCRNKLIKNLLINNIIVGAKKRSEILKKEGFKPPFFFVISPTARCNLNCVGCYAGDYTKKDDLSFGLIDRVLKEAKELGIYSTTISGGEPFIRDDIFHIFKKHNEMYFLVYSNGTLINEKTAKKLSELGNIAVAISVEGFEKETNKRRGNGVHKKVLEAMSNLKKYGVLFGFSTTATKYNSGILASDEFVTYYLRKGCLYGWYFQYLPIGKNPDISLMATPEQRNRLRQRVSEMRANKPIFIGDFWNDGPNVSGCIAGAREGGYFHIISTGDVEPCVFMHFAVDNIKNKSLKEVMNSDFFKAIRKAQPYCKNKNLLAPCAIIDHPHILRGVVKKYNAYPTHPGSECIIKDKKITDLLDKNSKRFKEITDPIWERDYLNNKNSRWYINGKEYHRLCSLKL